MNTEMRAAEVEPARAYMPATKPLTLRSELRHSSLTGRTLQVAQIADIRLRPGEVVLTFDDGPHPSRTGKILDALDEYGVKATFLSVGRMAKNYPEIIQEVARRGHTVGTHTHDHENLAKQSLGGAMSKIAAGYRAVSAALAPIGEKPALFFRFPYLADTQVLRAHLADDRMVVLDVDIDSKDYKTATPKEVMDRTLAKLEKRGKGIILFHDIQARTARMMPDFLKALSERGYEVVHLVPSRGGLFDRELVTAELD